MKKKILFSGVILLFGVMPWFTSCDPCLGNVYHKGQWYVKNLTDQTLQIGYSLRSQMLTVVPGDSARIGTALADGCYDPERLINFYTQLDKLNYNEYSLRVFSEQDVLLKQWKYSERELPGRQFFNVAFQHTYEFPEIGINPPTTVWTFDILPEDIQ